MMKIRIYGFFESKKCSNFGR